MKKYILYIMILKSNLSGQLKWLNLMVLELNGFRKISAKKFMCHGWECFLEGNLIFINIRRVEWMLWIILRLLYKGLLQDLWGLKLFEIKRSAQILWTLRKFKALNPETSWIVYKSSKKISFRVELNHPPFKFLQFWSHYKLVTPHSLK